MKKIARGLSAVLIGMLAVTAHAAEKRKFCVFDPLGATGPVFNLTKTTKVKALGWGYDFDMTAYTDEKIASDDFKAGQCDGVLLTDVRAREYNRFTATLVAMGAMPSYEQLKTVLQTLSQPKAAALMSDGNYEVAGIAPAGAIYVFTRDRSIDRVERIQGRKVATLDYDPAAVVMVRKVGASVVSATTSSFAGKFNNGSVDVAYAPAVAYTPLELYKGVEPNGGIFQYNFAQMTFQAILHKSKFNAEFAQKMREYYHSRHDEFMEIITKAEADIPESAWIRPTAEDAQGFDNMLKDVRIALRDEGLYEPKALKLMLKVRCSVDPSKAECSDGRE